MPRAAARKPSDLQDEIATFYEHLVYSVIEDGGVFRGDNFASSQRKTIAGELSGLAQKWRERADKNRSIDN